ncbi:hypothetical protein CJ030_MR8G021809 [Morella rubra]|uniref:Pentacotripeptide-repeat region of PRORP domain-containing protein n=1 Tax=Morella rubra TaxID=262757 RepID=A0A6A1UVV5_9ROSI|nr:hypothetical protein CJ030_MR8G021809 [Morella rubra]
MFALRLEASPFDFTSTSSQHLQRFCVVLQSLHAAAALSQMPPPRPRRFLSLYVILCKPNPYSDLQTISRQFSSLNQAWVSVPGNPLIKWPQPQSSLPHPNPDPSSKPDPSPSPNHFSILSDLLTDPTISPGPHLEASLDRAGIEPDPSLLQSIFDRFDSSPKLLHTLFVWAEKQPGFRSSAPLFNSVINVLAKSKKFDSAWSLVLERIGEDEEEPTLVSGETFSIMIRRYTRAGMTQSAIRTFEFAQMKLFEILLDSLCKEGHVEVASDYLDQKRKLEPSWVPSLRVYNILLNGWFRSRKLKKAEQLWERMKMDDVKPSVVTYGTLVEGYCRMRRAERAIELERLDLAVQVSQEMRARGCDMDLATSTMLVHLLCKMHRLEEALVEFGDMIRRGVIPQYLTFKRMNDELKKQGRTDLVQRLRDMMSTIPHSTKLPNTYRGDGDESRARRTSIMRKAEAMSDLLKTSTDPRELIKNRSSSRNVVLCADQLMESIKEKVNKT